MLTKARVLSTCGVVICALTLVARRRSRRRHQQSNQQSARKPTGNGALPIYVDHEALSNGWAVSPSIYYPPRLAVIPFVSPECLNAEEEEDHNTVMVKSHGSKQKAEKHASLQQQVFILCEEPVHPLEGSADSEEALFKKYMTSSSSTPLSAISSSSTAGMFVNISSILDVCFPKNDNNKDDQKEEAATRAPAFTCAYQNSDAILLFGRHGQYVCTAVLLGFERLDENNLQSGPAHEVITGLLRATHVVALDEKARRGGGGGQYRVSIAHKDQLAVLSMPAKAVEVRCPKESGKGGDVLVQFVDATAPSSAVSALELTPSELSVLKVNESLAQSIQTDKKKKELAERIQVRQFLDRSSDNGAEHTVAADSVTTVYTHEKLGALFSVNSLGGGMVVEPTLCDVPSALYYPVGERPTGLKDADVVPRFSLELYPTVPTPWESTLGTDDELLHNVRFHFTEWDIGVTACSLIDLSGLKCVQFTETKDGVRCKTYVVPKKKGGLLVIRCETAEAEWVRFKPLRQGFMDTLNLQA